MTRVSASLGLPLEFLQWSAPCHPKPNNESLYTGLCVVWLWQWAVSDTGLWHWASPGTPGFTAHGGDSALWFGPRAVPALPVPAKGSGGQTTECASSRWGYSTSSCPSCTSVKDSLLPRLLWGQWGTAVTSATLRLPSTPFRHQRPQPEHVDKEPQAVEGKIKSANHKANTFQQYVHERLRLKGLFLVLPWKHG